MTDRTHTECWLRGVYDKTRCNGDLERWLLMRDGDAGRAVQVIVCAKHAALYTFTQVVAAAVGAPRPAASTARRITRLRVTPQTAGLKVKRSPVSTASASPTVPVQTGTQEHARISVEGF